MGQTKQGGTKRIPRGERVNIWGGQLHGTVLGQEPGLAGWYTLHVDEDGAHQRKDLWHPASVTPAEVSS